MAETEPLPYSPGMSTLTAVLQSYVDELLKAHPAIEDIWLLEANAAHECALDAPYNLIVISPDDQEAHKVEHAARQLVRSRFEGSGIDVFVFSLSTMTRTPRPLMLKMALTSGENIYCK